MHKLRLFLWSAACLFPVAALAQFAQAPAAPAAPVLLCRVLVTSTPRGNMLRTLTIELRPDCPPHGVAYVRLASALGGHLPDDPPGAYSLRPGQTLRRVALPWWHVEWLSASNKPYRVREEAP